MPRHEDLKRLNRYALFSRLASLGVLLVGLASVVLFLKPLLLGVDSESHEMYQGEIIWLVAGTILSLTGSVFLFITSHWPGELRKVVSNTKPVKMTVKLEVEEDSYSTAYFAVISKRNIETEKTPAWRAQIWIHPPRIKEDAGQPFEGDVYFHPKTSLPVAIEYSRGVLWVMTGNGAVKKVVE